MAISIKRPWRLETRHRGVQETTEWSHARSEDAQLLLRCCEAKYRGGMVWGLAVNWCSQVVLYNPRDESSRKAFGTGRKKQINRLDIVD
jgi:hypothetical protein